MKQYKNHTIKEYLTSLAEKQPVPGGGSAAALTGATGAALITMVARYSIGKGQSKAVDKQLSAVVKQSQVVSRRLLELVDLDAKAYLHVVRSKGKSKAVKAKADLKARAVPLEICRQCFKAVELTPVLVQYGNKHLMSDVEASLEFLLAGFNAALKFVKV